ncbi:hypothetical protein B7R54_16050 [Subtercola boreus]|uniref:Tryptophan-rich sensory protein n=1 Tax=Subtercola boreus TaxID=120213 RepID=A0A3E0VLN5_9MICO|nr:tryptophan-rich sensory protein [Subtercola boreus]RFA10549.1 hypothetical protein B7R54_16050 [Subtercola boreus]TQL55910.1 TspO/MBR related protein [Subtercola boreus]
MTSHEAHLESGQHAPSSDRLRQVLVAVGAVVALVGSFIGSGAAGGTPIAEAAGGALSADATLLAPAGGAFSIWSVIYLGLVAYAIWQFLPAQRADDRQRRLGYPVLLTLVLNAAWILSVQAGLLALSAVVIVLLLVALCWAYSRAIATRGLGRRSLIGTLLVDGTLGLYLGWVSVATAANLTSYLQFAGFTGFGWSPEAWGITIVAVAGLVGVLVAVWSRGSVAPMLSLAWGLVWIDVSRVSGSLPSRPVAMAALVAAVVVVVVTLVARIVSARRARPTAVAR